MKNNTFRRLLAMAAAGAMLTSIAACGSSSNDDTASNGSDSTSLISVNNSEPQNGLIPSDTNEMGGGRVIRYLFEGLVSFDAKGKQHLEVAESITPNQAPIGNGPYKFKSWSHDKNIIVVPNKDYKGSRKVSNKGIEYRVYTNEDSAYSDVLSGNLDVMDQIPQSAVKTFRQDSSVIAYSQAGSSFQSFVIPERLEHFGNDEEGQLRRQAISMAIDRDQIVKKVYNNTKTPTTDFTSPLVPEYVKKLEQNGSNLKYNASKAKELWKKANAIKPWSGNFRIAYNADGGHKEWVDAVCNQIKNTLDIDAAGEPYATFSDVRNQVTNRTIKTAFRAGWMLDYPSAEDYLNPLYASSSADGHGSNDGDYKSAEFDKLLNAALAQTDVKKRTEDFTKAQEVLAKDLPVIPLWNDNVAAASATNVKNVSFDYTNLPTYNTITK